MSVQFALRSFMYLIFLDQFLYLGLKIFRIFFLSITNSTGDTYIQISMCSTLWYFLSYSVLFHCISIHSVMVIVHCLKNPLWSLSVTDSSRSRIWHLLPENHPWLWMYFTPTSTGGDEWELSQTCSVQDRAQNLSPAILSPLSFSLICKCSLLSCWVSWIHLGKLVSHLLNSKMNWGKLRYVLIQS